MNVVVLDQNHVWISNLKHMKIVKSKAVLLMDNTVLTIIKIAINTRLLINVHGVVMVLHVILKKIFVDRNSVKILLIQFNVILQTYYVILRFVHKGNNATTIINNVII